MSYGGHRGAGERVLEGRHVIGLFLAVILLSGLFFTLGYVMGLHQSEASADDLPKKLELSNSSKPAKPEVPSKRASKTPPAEPPSETNAPTSSEWEFYHAGEKGKGDDRLKPDTSVPSPQLQQSAPVFVKSPSSRSAGTNASRTSSVAATSSGYALQVAAMNKESDALDLAKVLQKKKFPAYVLSPHGDKYYRVQVGPYADLKAADLARKGLEDAGFKAFVKR